MRKKHAGIVLTTILAASLLAGCGSDASDKKELCTRGQWSGVCDAGDVYDLYGLRAGAHGCTGAAGIYQ